MEGPAGVVALVLAETAAGGSALLWLVPLWGRVRRGFFILTLSVLLSCALLGTVAGSLAVDPPVEGPWRLGLFLAAATSSLLGLAVAALILRLDAVGRWVGVAAVVPALAMLVPLAAQVHPSPSGIAQVIVGAAFMGAAMNGLLLGHWYLVDRRLTRQHIRRYAALLIGAVVAEAGAVSLLLGMGGAASAPGFNPLLAIGSVVVWLALGMVACTALIAVLIRASLRGGSPRAVQAATGFFYLAVITAFTAEMAAKVRFLA